VIGRLLSWIRREREWTRSHRIAWKGASSLTANGLSHFQVQCESAIAAALATSGRSLTNRVVHAGSEPYVSASISASSLRVWIYVDQANLDGPGIDNRFEEWDAISPAALIDDFGATMLSKLDGASAHAV